MGQKRLKKAKSREAYKPEEKEKKTPSKVKKRQTVDLTKNNDPSLDREIEEKPKVKVEPEDKFVIDRSTAEVKHKPLFERRHFESASEILTNLRSQSNLVEFPGVYKPTKQEKEQLEKKNRRQLKRLNRRKEITKKEDPGLVDAWSENAPSVPTLKKSININNKEDVVNSCPLSYNPDPNSESLRTVIKEAALVLSRKDKKDAKIKLTGEKMICAKISEAEKMKEFTSGFFDEEGDGVEEEESGERRPPIVLPGRVSKKDREKRAINIQQKITSTKRKEKNRLLNDIFRLKSITKDVSATAARRSALWSCHRETAQKRREAMMTRWIAKKATIQAIKTKQATALIKSAPGSVIGDQNGMKTGESLRKIKPQSNNSVFELFTSAQKKGLLLDMRIGERSRKANRQQKARGYKAFEVNR